MEHRLHRLRRILRRLRQNLRGPPHRTAMASRPSLSPALHRDRYRPLSHRRQSEPAPKNRPQRGGRRSGDAGLASVDVPGNHDPVGQGAFGHREPGEPPGLSHSRIHTCRRTRRGTFAIRSSIRASSPASPGVWSSPRWRTGTILGGAVGVARPPAGPERDRDGQLDGHGGPCALPRQQAAVLAGSTLASPRVRPVRPASFRSSTDPACPTSPFPSAVTDSSQSHSVRSLTRRES